MEQRKQFARKFLIPFIILILIYWMIMSAVNLHYGQPSVSIWTEGKYVISVLLDKLDIEILHFDVPPEYAAYIYQNGYTNPEISGNLYHCLLDLLPHAMAYQYFLYYLPFSIFVSFLIWGNAPRNKEKEFKQDQYIRGTRKISSSDYCRKTQKRRDTGIVLQTKTGKLLLSRNREKEHFAILGSTGTGKSTLLIAIVREFVLRKTRLVFLDRKGEFFAHFGQAKDILFNPFDARSTAWNIFNEINFELDATGHIDKIPPDLQVVADLLFGVNDIKRIKNKYWYTSGASVFCSAVCWCALHGKTTTKELVEFLSSAPDKIIASFKTLPASLQVGLSALGTKPDAEVVGQIMSMVADCSHQLACFVGLDGDWSVRDWINNDTNNLYISTTGKNDTNFTSIVTLLLDLIGRELKGFPDNGEQDTKIVIVIDELGSLSALDTLTFLLTQARSKGVAVIIANQTFERLREVYGDHAARNIMACCKSRFFFQLPEATDAKYIADTLGQAEVERTTQSDNESSGSMLSTGNNRKGKSINRSIVKDDAFLPADIASLKTGEAIICLPDLLPDIAKISLERLALPIINNEFVPRDVHEVAAKSIMQVISEDVKDVPENTPEMKTVTKQSKDIKLL